MQSRIAGERSVALRRAKAVSQTTENPWALGQVSLLLALLGETDLAGEVLDKGRKRADAGYVPLMWADLAVRLGRGEQVPAPPRGVERPAGPERDVVALRAAYRRSGMAGLGAALKLLPPGILDIDWDVRALSALAQEAGPPKQELALLEKRSDKGNAVASYVLGVLATRDKDYKLAARRLDKALVGHGDACQAASLYLEALEHLGRQAQTNKTGLRNVRIHNSMCPLPEL